MNYISAIKMKSHSPATYEKGENSLLKHKILSIIKFIRFKNKNKQQQQQQEQQDNVQAYRVTS